jgi:hypothetical protein
LTGGLAALLLTLAAMPAATAPRAVAAHIAGSSVRLDGRLDEEVWLTAPVVRDFVQREPKEGAPPADPMEVRFAYDDEALYVGAHLSARAGTLQAPLSRRDDAQQAEHVVVTLDSFHDRRTAYAFGVTAAGTRLDWYHARDSPEVDDTWDPVWQAHTTVDDTGWSAEMRIPLSQLRYSAGALQVWGLNIERWRPAIHEHSMWALVTKKEAGWVSHFGELTGLDGLRSSRRTELLPYSSVSTRFEGGDRGADPFARQGRPSGRLGGDLKAGVGSNLTAEGSVNPDFGQVEADPAEVNLTAFETSFAEKRPFFIEGASLLGGNGPTYYYSRRIGGPPRGSATGDYVDVPRATSILGATKLTGRLPSGLSVGALGAVTSRARAQTFDTVTGRRDHTRVEPGAAYGVARVQQEFGAHGSTAGLIFTGVRRDLTESDPLAALLPRSAVAGGGNALLRFAGGTYEIGGYAGFSHVAGAPAVIERLQLASARYYQRPDQDYLRLDPGRTTMSGWTASVFANKNGGEHWLWQVGASAESPGFELNDVGLVRTVDSRYLRGSLRYRETKPGPLFHEWHVEAGGTSEWTFGGDLQQPDTNGHVTAELVWKNYMRTTASLAYIPPSFDSRHARGGPTMARGRGASGYVNVAGNAAARTQWNARLGFFRDDDGARTIDGSGGLSLRPAPRWRIGLEPYFIHGTYSLQYVSTLDGGRPETFGSRYVFAAAARTTLATPIRASYVISPDLSIDLYAELFAASGGYRDWGELTAPRTRPLRSYGTDGTAISRLEDGRMQVRDGADTFVLPDLDFRVRSFRSNVVLRWEWRAGSTLYVVWQQDRLGRDPTGRRSSLGDMLRASTAPGDHHLAVKSTFYLPLR